MKCFLEIIAVILGQCEGSDCALSEENEFRFYPSILLTHVN
jgi:hypothetical protein